MIAHREQVIRISFAATFIFRGIMQLFPWIFIPGITGNFVIYPSTWELPICAIGLAFLLIRWKLTFFRIFIVWVYAGALSFQVFRYSYLVGEDYVYLTTSYWIFSFLTACTWAYGTGLTMGAFFDRVLDSLEKKGYFPRTIVQKEKKKKKRR